MQNFNFMAPFYGWGSIALRLQSHYEARMQFTFYCLVPENSWYSFDRVRRDERLS